MDTAQINTSDKMLWSQARDHVQNLVIKEIVALENKAKWHEEEHEEEDFSRIQKLQKYIVVMQKHYVMHYLFWREEYKMMLDDMPTLTTLLRKIIQDEIIQR